MSDINQAVSFLCARIQEDFDFWGKLNSKWINPIAELIIVYNEERTKENLEWQPREDKPEYDGSYLCFIEQPQECGNTWFYQKVVHLQFNEWVETEKNESVKYWKNLPDDTFCKNILNP